MYKKRVMLLGSGELGKEIAIALKRYDTYVVACDRYAGAPAMSVCDEAMVLNMLDGEELDRAIDSIRPDVIIPEIEAIDTARLFEAESRGIRVMPCAAAVDTAMNRRKLRDLVAEIREVRVLPFAFASSLRELHDAVKHIGLPCVVKPVMSSSGRGQTVLKNVADIEKAWENAITQGRCGDGGVMVEQYIALDSEMTLLVANTPAGVIFCEPIGHVQRNGDYVCSWQPSQHSAECVEAARSMALSIIHELGGEGIFGFEFFIKEDEVLFNEVSPRPHDTGMVTSLTQFPDEFTIHARLALGLPVAGVELLRPGASAALVAYGNGSIAHVDGIETAMHDKNIDGRIFGKGSVHGHRRIGVVIAMGTDAKDALERANKAAAKISIKISD
ncbi:MAG: formate-dependent phosphoribosylglycinamide formyltransferase [Bacteroidales bacterium]|nr:formate-dependent phosphoribosylglycinamide formyltransferase [Bacteroidales bacterium]